MATQRVTPFPENVADQSISIGYVGGNFVPSVAACTILGNGQQNVAFSNTTGTTVSINFVPDPVNSSRVVFNDIPNLVSGAPATILTPLVSNGSANYYINVGSDTYGPFAIQVGIGPLYVAVSTNATGGIDVNPGTVRIPSGGAWELYKNPSDTHTYNVSWPNITAPPFPNFTVDNTPRNAAQNGSFDYKVKPPVFNETIGHGGGTVRVGGG